MRVADVMTGEATTVRADASIAEAVALMVADRISGLPVLDADDRLVGVVTEGDLLRRAETGTGDRRRPKWLEFLLGPGHGAAEYVRTHSRRVADLMTREVRTVEADAPLSEAVDAMERARVKRLPVLRDGKVVGIISRTDLVRALGQALAAEAQPGAESDEAIQARLDADLRNQTWFAARRLNVSVKGGVVALDGVIADERVAEALRVAAQNIPGVKSVEDRLIWIDPTAGLVVSRD